MSATTDLGFGPCDLAGCEKRLASVILGFRRRYGSQVWSDDNNSKNVRRKERMACRLAWCP